ncbi:MAG: hypothetical protein V4725_07015 [Bacteroidota bacterium]
MNIRICFSFILMLLFTACGDKKTVPNTDIEVAQAFIQSILDNKFEDAEKFVLKEETNEEYFKLFKTEYKSKNKEELENYRNADIIINEIAQMNDSVSIINYSNSYIRNKSNKLKMVRVDGKWLVDLKYTFSGNM